MRLEPLEVEVPKPKIKAEPINPTRHGQFDTLGLKQRLHAPIAAIRYSLPQRSAGRRTGGSCAPLLHPIPRHAENDGRRILIVPRAISRQ